MTRGRLIFGAICCSGSPIPPIVCGPIDRHSLGSRRLIWSDFGNSAIFRQISLTAGHTHGGDALVVRLYPGGVLK